MARKLITVSKLKNITFYTGEDAENCGMNVENRNYGYESDIFGRLALNSEYNSYWENIYTNEDVDSLFKECGLKDDDELEYEDFIVFWRSHMRNN